MIICGVRIKYAGVFARVEMMVLGGEFDNPGMADGAEPRYHRPIPLCLSAEVNAKVSGPLRVRDTSSLARNLRWRTQIDALGGSHFMSRHYRHF